jgi:hypothetical protein
MSKRFKESAVEFPPVLKKRTGGNMIVFIDNGNPDDLPFLNKENWESAYPQFEKFSSLKIPIIYVASCDCNDVCGPSMIQQLNKSIHNSNYMPVQEIIRRLSVRENPRFLDVKENNYPLTRVKCFSKEEVDKHFKFERFDRNK